MCRCRPILFDGMDGTEGINGNDGDIRDWEEKSGLFQPAEPVVENRFISPGNGCFHGNKYALTIKDSKHPANVVFLTSEATQQGLLLIQF
jgi:hypothetical protein